MGIHSGETGLPILPGEEGTLPIGATTSVCTVILIFMGSFAYLFGFLNLTSFAPTNYKTGFHGVCLSASEFKAGFPHSIFVAVFSNIIVLTFLSLEHSSSRPPVFAPTPLTKV